MTPSATSKRIRDRRPAKTVVDPDRPLAVVREEERTAAGGRVPTVAVFLAGAECPFTCVFCDLWRNTLDQPTPEGALPRQLRRALEGLGSVAPECRLKLYNASNFFDARAVPPGDLDALAALAAPFARVVVECHPRLIGRSCLEFAERLEGRLEVAMGLESVHPEALPRFNKEMTLEDWHRAAATLRTGSIPLRAFVLLGAPFVPAAKRVDWTLITAAYAFESGAETVALIPFRAGADLEQSARGGDFAEPTLPEIEESFERGLALEAGFGNGSAGRVLLLDTWDLERFAESSDPADSRVERLARLRRLNLVGP